MMTSLPSAAWAQPMPPPPQPGKPVFFQEWTSSSIGLAREARPAVVAVSDPLQFFFPAATEVADFQSWEATSWHSYDPWWNASR